MDRAPEPHVMLAVAPGVRPKASNVVLVHVAVEVSCVPVLYDTGKAKKEPVYPNIGPDPEFAVVVRFIDPSEPVTTKSPK